MIVCESGGHANGLTYFIFRFLRRPQTAKQGYTRDNSSSFPLCLVRGQRPLNPKTLKMSAYGTLSPTARPPRVLPTPWALPTPAFATWQGCREKPPAPLPQSVGSPPTCKGQAASGCFASLDRFPAPSASDRLAIFTELERGQGRRSRAFTLDALEATQHSP